MWTKMPGENAVVQGLRAGGVDVLTTVEANQCGATDQDQLAFAGRQRRTIYTFNVGDFARLLFGDNYFSPLATIRIPVRL